MRPLFVDFPDDPRAWDVADQFMFGPSLLVAPVAWHGARERDVYLPVGQPVDRRVDRRRPDGGATVTGGRSARPDPAFPARRGRLDHGSLPIR